MASAIELNTRIESSLRGLLAEVDFLPQTDADWHALPDHERASTALDWDHLMASYLPEVDRAYRAGALSDEQQARYRLLLHRLHEALPIIERLNFYRPPVSLEG